MRRKSLSLTLISIVLVLVVGLPFATAQAQAAGLTVPVTGKATNGPRVSGTFTIRQFVATGDPINPIGAVGTLVLTTADGRMAATETTMPVTLGGGGAASGGATALMITCEILDLTLGPLDLNLLGLEIHLDRVHLTIDANPSGGLLGQILCALANTFPSDIQTIVGLLNQLLSLL